MGLGAKSVIVGVDHMNGLSYREDADDFHEARQLTNGTRDRITSIINDLGFNKFTNRYAGLVESCFNTMELAMFDPYKKTSRLANLKRMREDIDEEIHVLEGT